MRPTNASRLLFLLILSGCSTTSAPPRNPTFGQVQCPASQDRVDRSFASNPPACLATFTEDTSDGENLGGLAISLQKQITDRDICLNETNKWIASERKARDTGKPGA